MKIAVAGKGGVGKTFLAGTLARIFAARGRSVLALDADPAPNLGLVLGLGTGETRNILPLSENHTLVDSKTKTPFPGVFRLSFPVDDIIRDYTVSTPSGVNLLVAGTIREYGSGCSCPANNLLRTLLSRLITGPGDVVIVDLEAGLEHLGRATAEHVDLLLIVTDATPASLMIACRIGELTRNSGIRQVLLVGNRIRNESDRARVRAGAGEQGLGIAAWIPFDPGVLEGDIPGSESLPRNSPAYDAVNDFAATLLQVPENAPGTGG